MYRSRKTTKAYNPDKTRKEHDSGLLPCPFCELDDRPVHEDGGTMMVIPAKFPYEFWDYHNVSEHLMLVPKRHIEHFSQMSDAEKIESMGLLAKYEEAGYSVYVRSQTNEERTVPHQHIHLIKVSGRRFRFSLYTDKPYIVLHRK